MNQYGQVTGWGSYLPERIVTNEELEALNIGVDPEWIVRRTGIKERRIVADGETTATMSVAASRKALARSGLQPEQLDLIIVATSSPDYLVPAVSSQVQHMLGATDVPAFTLATGCTGFVYALSTAYQFIATGTYENILVVGVELLSRFVDWTDRSTCVLFGDGAGAFIVQATDKACGLEGFVLGSDGSGADYIIMPSGGSASPTTLKTLSDGGHFLKMNGREVFKFATRVCGRATREALARAGRSLDEIDWIIPHQANLRIIQAAARDIGAPLERFIITVDRFANNSAASIPIALCEALDEGRVQPTDRLLLVAFGSGLTWGACVLQMMPVPAGKPAAANMPAAVAAD